MIDKLKARAVERFFALLRHSKGRCAGQPFVLEGWQRDLVIPLLCEVDAEGRRVYRQAFLGLARKNGKSTLAAGVALWMLLADGESAPEVYSAASSRDQARLVFDQARAFVEASPILSKRARVYRHTIELADGSGVYRPISADTRRGHGLNASCVILDEAHALLDRELYDVLQTSMGAREQPLMVSISTAGRNRTSICSELWEYTRQVNAGIIEDRSFKGVTFAADPEDDPFSPATWAKANPNLGVSISQEY